MDTTRRVADYQILSGGGSIVGQPLGKWADDLVKRWFDDIQEPHRVTADSPESPFTG